MLALNACTKVYHLYTVSTFLKSVMHPEFQKRVQWTCGSRKMRPVLQNIGSMTFVSYHSFEYMISPTLMWGGGAFGTGYCKNCEHIQYLAEEQQGRDLDAYCQMKYFKPKLCILNYTGYQHTFLSYCQLFKAELF